MPLATVESANSSSSDRGSVVVKLRWNWSYRLRDKSYIVSIKNTWMMRRRLSAVGSTKYMAGTSATAALSPCNGLNVSMKGYRCNVMPCSRRSPTRNTHDTRLWQKLSRIRIFHSGGSVVCSWNIFCRHSDN